MTNNVAKTLSEQIGSRAFAMLGAKNILAKPDGLQFKIGTNAKKITNIVIDLMSDDTYRIQFWRIRGVDIRMIHEVHGVQVAELRSTIETRTGLYTSL